MSKTPALPKSLTVTPDKETEEYLDAAYAWVTIERPYYSYLLYTLKKVWVPDEVFDTMAVDHGLRMYLNPTFVLETGKRDIEELCGSIIHEFHHIIMGHGERRGDRDPTRWNWAGDMEINQLLIADKLKLPDGCLFPSTFGMEDDLNAEAYYEQFSKKEEQSQGDGDEESSPGLASGQCGSVATGKGDPSGATEQAAAEAGAEAANKEDIDVVLAVTATAVRDHQRENPGTLPAGLLRWAEELQKPKVRWQTQIRSAVMRTVKNVSGFDAHTYSRPNRRHKVEFGKAIMPRNIAFKPRVGVVVDTSGSMSPTMLTAALSEVDGILRAVGCTDVQVWACDAAAGEAQSVRSAKQVNLTGGGGTNMGTGINAALEGKRPSEMVIVLTDGDTPWPHEKPPVPVVVALVDGHRDTPDWAKAVVVDRKAA